MMSCALYGRLMLQMSRVNILSHRWWSWTMLWASDVVWCGAMLSLIVVRSGSQHWLLSGSSKLILDVTDSLHTPYQNLNNFIINPRRILSTFNIFYHCYTMSMPYIRAITILPCCYSNVPCVVATPAAVVCCRGLHSTTTKTQLISIPPSVWSVTHKMGFCFRLDPGALWCSGQPLLSCCEY